ncbi:dTDP-4-amino-4,6-dideoxygalactose transaminase [Aurantimicrobium minutum]|uniref:TDP-4-keto-6-deoxy-D-glucose aminotransferase n=1 Tax=Aurantimicrobium minutum TaxID=708131 RepID=A0A173LV81_9MICO|nr:dTDP-4-amino-4,6-dideoxygalactose transaminase [Aurantimicrobium minutum]BAU98740.1 TDP-4-keto-6-deoxy-D-glucose aminotransferase [Aurantimicrobium minutum]
MSGSVEPILFSVPCRAPRAPENLARVINSDHVHGDGPFTKSASTKLVELTGSQTVLLTTSGTAALEMAVRLLGITEGDEVILPSFTFSSGATSIVAAGGTPVFVDIEGNSGNIDPALVEAAITPKTKAISVMHYGGVPVDMDAIMDLSRQHNIPVIEDNAHGLAVSSKYGRLGTIGSVAIQSFHDTKNVHCGEGGALLINNPALVEAAEIMREKGTNRSKFLRGQVDKYTWVEWGSSFLPSELNAAVLDAQLDEFDTIQERRFAIWNTYKNELESWANDNSAMLMSPADGVHAAHVFFVVMQSLEKRDALLEHLRSNGVIGTFHYVPLHSSPAGIKYGRTHGSMEKTNAFSERLVRLPLWPGMSDEQVNRVLDTMKSFQ